MVAAGDEPSARIPTPEDLARIGRSLNQAGARYAIIGGFAMIHHGLARGTMDIDLLVDPSPENVDRVRQGLSVLEDQASLEVEPTDVQSYTVVRIADEIVVSGRCRPAPDPAWAPHLSPASLPFVP